MTYPPTWPDGTPKSMHNAFNWRARESTTTPTAGHKPPRSLDMHSNGNVYTYTKAKDPAKKFTPPPTPSSNKMFTIKKQ